MQCYILDMALRKIVEDEESFQSPEEIDGGYLQFSQSFYSELFNFFIFKHEVH